MSVKRQVRLYARSLKLDRFTCFRGVETVVGIHCVTEALSPDYPRISNFLAPPVPRVLDCFFLHGGVTREGDDVAGKQFRDEQMGAEEKINRLNEQVGVDE